MTRNNQRKITISNCSRIKVFRGIQRRPGWLIVHAKKRKACQQRNIHRSGPPTIRGFWFLSSDRYTFSLTSAQFYSSHLVTCMYCFLCAEKGLKKASVDCLSKLCDDIAVLDLLPGKFRLFHQWIISVLCACVPLWSGTTKDPDESTGPVGCTHIQKCLRF